MTILNIDEAAEFLRMSRRSLEKLVREGKVPATQLVNKWVFSDAQLQAYIEKLSENNVKITVDELVETAPPPNRRRRNMGMP